MLTVKPGDTEYGARVKMVFRAIATVAFDTGERKMEILNLKRPQLHLHQGYIATTSWTTQIRWEAVRKYEAAILGQETAKVPKTALRDKQEGPGFPQGLQVVTQ